MKTQPKSFYLALFLGGFFSACSSFINVENAKPKTPKELRSEIFDPNSLNKLAAGDSLKVFTIGKKVNTVYFQKIEEGQLIGVLTKVDSYLLFEPRPIEIPLSEIEKVKVKKVSTPYTIAVVGVVLGVLSAISLFVML